MAKNDYFTIVYKLLQILYEDLKEGNKTDLKRILNDTDTFPINSRYWISIFEDITQKGYIKGVSVVSVVSGGRRIVEKKDGIRITVDGVSYLKNNKEMKKAKEVWGTVKDFIPMAVQVLTQ